LAADEFRANETAAASDEDLFHFNMH